MMRRRDVSVMSRPARRRSSTLRSLLLLSNWPANRERLRAGTSDGATRGWMLTQESFQLRRRARYHFRTRKNTLMSYAVAPARRLIWISSLVPSCCWKQSLQDQLCLNPQLKIVPNNCASSRNKRPWGDAGGADVEENIDHRLTTFTSKALGFNRQ